MIKNTVKLMMATTLATALVVVVTESADAQIRGRRYSRSNRVPDLRLSLIFETSEGQIIRDQDGSNENEAGFFSGAIEDVFYLGTNDFFRFRFGLGDLSTKLEGDTVEYTIFSQSPFQLNCQRGCQSLVGQEAIDINPGPIYTFELNVSGFSQEDRNNYVNSLQFIVENNLYNPENFQNESFVRETFVGFDLAVPVRGTSWIITDIPATTPSNPQPVPEPSTSIPSLLFGAFSLGLLIKRKMKMKQVEQFQG
jgi:hypothetical protein